jgi:hypothetical protein
VVVEWLGFWVGVGSSKNLCEQFFHDLGVWAFVEGLKEVKKGLLEYTASNESKGLLPLMQFPVILSSSDVWAKGYFFHKILLFSTWNLMEGPAGAFPIHRYMSLFLRLSKNKILLHELSPQSSLICSETSSFSSLD